jgi:predicted HicB family RNase H-like nuclease
LPKKIERRGRPPVRAEISIERGRMFKARIPRVLHAKMKRAAKAQNLALGRWLVELGARAIGAKITAPKCGLRKKAVA